jgi:hypothetical protein
VILVVVAYAHVILELAVAVLAVALAVRVIMSPAPGVLATHIARHVHARRARRRIAQQPATVNGRAVDRSTGRSKSRGRRGRPTGGSALAGWRAGCFGSRATRCAAEQPWSRGGSK